MNNERSDFSYFSKKKNKQTPEWKEVKSIQQYEYINVWANFFFCVLAHIDF